MRNTLNIKTLSKGEKVTCYHNNLSIDYVFDVESDLLEGGKSINVHIVNGRWDGVLNDDLKLFSLHNYVVIDLSKDRKWVVDSLGENHYVTSKLE